MFTDSVVYGLEACPLKSDDLKSLDYIVVGAFMNFFKTKSKEVAILAKFSSLYIITFCIHIASKVCPNTCA